MILDFLYLFLDLFTLSFPLLRSFDPKLDFYKKWHALFPALGIIGVVPFACMFIYEATLYYIKKRPLQSIARPFTFALAMTLLVLGFLNMDLAYTRLTFIATGVFLLFHVLFIKRDYLDRFYVGYLFSLIPFLLVNGVLTGSFIEDQIVWYNNEENLGIRIFTIPIEDSVYLLLYLLSITTIYEQILKRF